MQTHICQWLSTITSRNIKHRLTVAFALFGVGLILYGCMPSTVSAVTQQRLKTYLDGGVAPAYDPDFCGAGSSGGDVATATGAAATQMQKAGLDQKWIDLIVKFAKQYKTDPLAMASVFFWENRKFPPYGEIRNGSDSGGRGPWQFTVSSWNNKKYGDYIPNVYDPVKSTEAAAELIKSYGGTAGSPAGYIAQSFAKGNAPDSTATVVKNYNAGQGTYRIPSSATWNQSGRVWTYGPSWGSEKARIIDDYIVGTTYVYYQIASAGKITFKDTDSYVQEALKKQDTIKNFVFKDTGTDSAGTKVTTESTTTSSNPVIVIDPGHSGKDNVEYDPTYGIKDYDYPNHPELEDMWDVGKLVEAGLKKDGYTVILTKKSASDTVSLIDRANIANQNKAALAVSLHDMAGSNGGNTFGKWGEIYYQFQGAYRQSLKTGKKKTFDNDAVAKLSTQYASNFQETREKTEGLKPTIKKNDYTRKDDKGNYVLDPGNLGIVQLFANVPWVYMEAGGNSAGRTGLNDGDKKKYAEGIIAGVEKSVKPGQATDTGSGDCSGDVTGGGGGVSSIVDMALQLAWSYPYGANSKYDSDNKRTSSLTPKPEYASAAKKYDSRSGMQIADCGVFVATVMRASGADPDYPQSYTPAQADYVKKSKKYDVFPDINKVGDLKPGDILIVNAGSGAGALGHTMIYVGKQGKYDEASASLGTRMGNLGNTPANLDDSSGRGHYIVARLKQ
jgi:N-acetylmuramoyl-L-alanine amidase